MPQTPSSLDRPASDGVLAVIPARLASTRLPRKMLLAETGRPLVQHVVDRVRLCTTVDEIVVATDDEQILDALRPLGTHVVMTSSDHVSGTDRVAEIARSRPHGLVVNVQGDEPEIEPANIDRLIRLMRERGGEMGTLVTPFPSDEDVANPSLVKAVVAPDGRALYFSRSVVPFSRDGKLGAVLPMLHMGVYAYSRAFLLRLATLAPTPLERTEMLEQLRVLEHGHTIWTTVAPRPPHTSGGIDTAEQYAAFVDRWRSPHRPDAERHPGPAPTPPPGQPAGASLGIA